MNRESLQYLIDYCNTDYYKNDIELFFQFVELRQIEEGGRELIERLLSFEQTYHFFNKADVVKEMEISKDERQNLKTMQMNSKNYE